MYGCTDLQVPRLIDYASASAHEASIRPIRGTALKPLAERHKKWVTIERADSQEIVIRAHGDRVLTYYPDNTVLLHNTANHACPTSSHDVVFTVTKGGSSLYAYNRNCQLTPFQHDGRMWVFVSENKDENFSGSYLPVPPQGFKFIWERADLLRTVLDENVYRATGVYPVRLVHKCLNPEFPQQTVVDRKKANALKQSPELKPFRDYFLGAVKAMVGGPTSDKDIPSYYAFPRSAYVEAFGVYKNPDGSDRLSYMGQPIPKIPPRPTGLSRHEPSAVLLFDYIKSSDPEDNYKAMLWLLHGMRFDVKSATRVLDEFLYTMHPEVLTKRILKSGKLFREKR